MAKTPRKILALHEMKGTSYPTVVDLPGWMTDGIGKVIAAQAYLEWRLSVVMFDLLVIDHPEGRVSFKDQGAYERFKIIKNLLALRGIKLVNLDGLGPDIEETATIRNQLAHGIWSLDGANIKLRLTKDSFDTEEGQHNRSFLPQMADVPSDYFIDAVAFIKHVTGGVNSLEQQVWAAMRPLLQKRGLRDEPGFPDPDRKT